MHDELTREIVALQHILLDAARRHPTYVDGTLSTAARLDYALMLATGTAGVPLDPAGVERAIDDALVGAFDDVVRFLARLFASDRREALTFCAEHGGVAVMLARLGVIERRDGVRDAERRFALITMAEDLTVT